MIIKNVKFTNYKPYFGEHFIDLSVEDDGRNIILIGGENGMGKTSFLTAIVWCFFGNRMKDAIPHIKEKIDGIGGINKFLQLSINNLAKEKNINEYKIEVNISNISMKVEDDPEINKIKLIRKYDVSNGNEKFEIWFNEDRELKEEVDKINFVNDYLIPLGTAKFVFFDGARLGELTRENDNYLDEALEKVIGLERFENIIKEIKKYRQSIIDKHSDFNSNIELRKDKEHYNNSIKIKKLEIESEEQNIYDTESELEKNRQDLIELNTRVLNKEGVSEKELKALEQQKDRLKENTTKLETELNNKLDKAHYLVNGKLISDFFKTLNKEISYKNDLKFEERNHGKINEVFEKLFNLPELPIPDLNKNIKQFYFDKLNKILSSDQIKKEFKTIGKLNEISKQNYEFLQKIFEEICDSKNNELDKDITNLQSLKSELVKYNNKYHEAFINLNTKSDENLKVKKNEIESKIDDSSKCIEDYKSKIMKLENDINDLNNSINIVEEKIRVTKAGENKKSELNRYISVLEKFIKTEKENKLKQIEIFLNSNIQKYLCNGEFITNIEINQKNNSLIIDFYNNDARINPSDGQKLIINSVLFIAILSESIMPLPAFIDSPMGNLDREHRINLIKYYYPKLSKQVILFSHNEEITPSLLKNQELNNLIKRKYLIKRQEGNKGHSNAQIIEGKYFE